MGCFPRNALEIYTKEFRSPLTDREGQPTFLYKSQ